MSGPESCQGFVLHRRPHGETSQLLRLFTRELGRIDVIAKGLRKRAGSKGDSGMLFQPMQFSLQGQGSLRNLHGLEATAPALMAKDKALFCGLYINELLVRLLDKELPLEGIFARYWQVLKALCEANSADTLEGSLREFELNLLDELGFGIDCHYDSQGEAIRADMYYRLIDGGSWLASMLDGPSTLYGESILAIGQRQWHRQSLHAAKWLTRTALAPHLGRKPLHSRALFQAYLQEEDS